VLPTNKFGALAETLLGCVTSQESMAENACRIGDVSSERGKRLYDWCDRWVVGSYCMRKVECWALGNISEG
jgi:hypothetical protein